MFWIGVIPNRLDLLTGVTGLTFLRNKEAIGRPQDLADAAWLRNRGKQ